MSGCIATEVCPALCQNIASCQITSIHPPALNISSLPCPTEGVESLLMEGSFLSLEQRLDASELMPLPPVEDSEQVLSANLSASLQLADNSTPENPSNEKDVQENINMDSFDRYIQQL